MTDQEINIALAKWDGWNWWKPEGDQRTHWSKPGCGSSFAASYDDQPKPIPSYTTDLNAVHALEMKLTREQMWPTYYDNLCSLFDWDMVDLCRATALQRCEALLRTLNLWKD